MTILGEMMNAEHVTSPLIVTLAIQGQINGALLSDSSTICLLFVLELFFGDFFLDFCFFCFLLVFEDVLLVEVFFSFLFLVTFTGLLQFLLASS